MPHVTVYFDDAIKLVDVMRAAEHIGCTLKGDKHTGALLIVRKGDYPTEDFANLIPNWLRRQAD